MESQLEPEVTVAVMATAPADALTLMVWEAGTAELFQAKLSWAWSTTRVVPD